MKVSDLVAFLEHEDPGLRGAAARLVFRVLRGNASVLAEQVDVLLLHLIKLLSIYTKCCYN